MRKQTPPSSNLTQNVAEKLNISEKETQSSTLKAENNISHNNNNNDNENKKIEEYQEKKDLSNTDISIVQYRSEHDLPDIMLLMEQALSEPYSVFTYRYFLHSWPQLSFKAMEENECIGAIVCKIDIQGQLRRGYIAMLAVRPDCRKRGIGSRLVQQAIHAIIDNGADQVILETEVSNQGAIALYQNLGFIKDKRLHKYYLNGADAFRLKLLLR